MRFVFITAILGLLAACASQPIATTQPAKAAISVNDDSNAAWSNRAVSGNTKIPMGADADAVNYDPVKPAVEKKSEQPEKKPLRWADIRPVTDVGFTVLGLFLR